MAKKSSSTKSSGGIGGFFKKILFVIMLLAIIALGGFVYLLINFDSIKGKMAERIDIQQEKIALDSEHFEKVKIHLNINNNLPFEVVFKNMVFEMTVDGYKVLSKDGKDNKMQAVAMVPLKPNVGNKTIITCDVGEPAVIKRAIQKAIEKNAGKLIKAVLSQKSVKKEISDDIKAITNVKGTADFMIKIGSMEIPFQKNLVFN